MKPGDLVKDQHPFAATAQLGVILSEDSDPYGGGFALNKAFKVLWHNGTVGSNVWDYDLEVISETR